MPRVSIKKKEYKAKDFGRWVKGQLVEQGYTQADLSDWLNISQQAVSYKLSKNQFNYQDLITIFHELQTDSETIAKLLIY